MDENGKKLKGKKNKRERKEDNEENNDNKWLERRTGRRKRNGKVIRFIVKEEKRILWNIKVSFPLLWHHSKISKDQTEERNSSGYFKRITDCVITELFTIV